MNFVFKHLNDTRPNDESNLKIHNIAVELDKILADKLEEINHHSEWVEDEHGFVGEGYYKLSDEDIWVVRFINGMRRQISQKRPHSTVKCAMEDFLTIAKWDEVLRDKKLRPWDAFIFDMTNEEKFDG